MGIELFIEPGKNYSWDEFRSEKEPYSIALDGIVKHPTARDVEGPYGNLDHHHGVDAMSTRSTTGQSNLEIDSGIFELFQKKGKPYAKLYANHPDQDVCSSYWLFKNKLDFTNEEEKKRIEKLVNCEDLLDSTAGSYSFPDETLLKKMAWMFEPYDSSRFEGTLNDMDSNGMEKIVEDVSSRITDYVKGNSGELELEGNFEILFNTDTWAMVEETGPASRLAMHDAGINAFISYRGQKENGHYCYSAGRKSVWNNNFPLPKIFWRLNEMEGYEVNDNNCWGGRDNIGGPPQYTGSKFSPPILFKKINEIIAE